MTKDKIVYKCLNERCNHEFIGSSTKDGIGCPECKSSIVPIREATKEDILTCNPTVKINTNKNQIKVKDKSIIILRTQSNLTAESIKELEEKYSNKFGCKVVILESNLDFVEFING